MNHRLPSFALILAMLLWGSSFIALKYAINEMHPVWVIFGRMLLATFCFALVFKVVMKFRYQAGDWKRLAIMSLCEPCLYFVLEGEAMRHTSAGQAGMITALLPLLVAVMAWFSVGERVNRNMIIGFATAIAGVLWLTLAGTADAHAPNALWGNFLEFLAMICAAIYSINLKHLSSRYPALTLTAFQAFCGAIFFAPMLFWVPIPESVSGQALLAIVYLGVVVTLGAYLLYNYAISKVKVTAAAGYVNLIPVFSLLFAYLLLGERLNGQQMVAAGVIILGVVISQWRIKESADAVGKIIEDENNTAIVAVKG
ncbi:DMT family transporter [Corallincola luteus]|uniref:DMT family transporter n=2 Tax=Corallincola TaxID=1775176 RepID=A0A368NLU4_9GAMM|nr:MULTISPECIES: DMT family transporter [Corallincola]RCU50409.1 DMT family transporter [Corallincola holothuriorum]TCI05561.1 DMT family transporter [Corallincola luteus]